MTFDRPPREIYIRQSRPMCCAIGATIDVGLEWRGDALAREQLGVLLFTVDEEHQREPSRPTDAVSLATHVEDRILKLWPDRAYFIEAWTGSDEGGFIQIFQPFGVPRNETASQDAAVIERLDRLINCVIDVETSVDRVDKSVNDFNVDMNRRDR